MPKRVLVPLDGSAFSEMAIEHAVDSAGSGGQLILCRAPEVIPVPVMAKLFEHQEVVQNAQEQLNQEVADYLQQWAARLAERGLRVSTIQLQGAASESILACAQAEKVDLIVMSSQGRSGLDRLLFGSVAEQVWRHSTCPVLLLGARATRHGTG